MRLLFDTFFFYKKSQLEMSGEKHNFLINQKQKTLENSLLQRKRPSYDDE